MSEWGRKRIGVILNVAQLVYGVRQDGLTIQTRQNWNFLAIFLMLEILKRKKSNPSDAWSLVSDILPDGRN